MTNLSKRRRGSALLVVLGMLAFMLFSGLAFSVYMRQTRLPTSFLRRTVATRQLAKAALAEAIEEIDQAIGNDPHPGVHAAAQNAQYDPDEVYNLWSHRVFFGLAGETQHSQMDTGIKIGSTTYYPDFAEKDETVPTLTLEGLAYLPPNLINEARFFSQRTPTAKWHSFWFDSGRYAYTAFDVSDYFDVNRVYASRPRSSGTSGRVSFAHLFEDTKSEDHDDPGKGAKEWDDFMKDYRLGGGSGDPPLISLADFNIAWKQEGSLDFGSTAVNSPFVNMVESNNGLPYPGGTTEAERFRGMTFVTDSWFPKTTAQSQSQQAQQVYDLATTPAILPDDLKFNHGCNLQDVFTYADGLIATEPLASRMSMITRAALWDYLDQDKIPISLALPTCEQVPMICGIQPSVSGLKVLIKADFDPANDSGPTAGTTAGGVDADFYTREVTYKIDLSGISDATYSMVYALAYPFLLKGQPAQTVTTGTSARDDEFTVDGRIAVFLTDAASGTMSARPGMINGLYLTGPNDITQSGVLNSSVVAFKIQTDTNMPKNPEDLVVSGGTGDGAANGNYPVKGSSIPLSPAAQGVYDLVTVKYRWPKVLYPGGRGANANPPPQTISDPTPGQPDHTVEQGPTLATANNFAILKADGTPCAASFYDFLANATLKQTVNVNLAVWLRVVDKENKTVDLVPACLKDDKPFNQVNNDSSAIMLAPMEARSYPLLRLQLATANGQPLELSYNGIQNAATTPLPDLGLQDTQLLTGDPRYNHAPEDWLVVKNTTMQGDDLAKLWYTTEYADAKNKDGDVYMATSDQKELQSVWELAFLPRLQNGLTLSGKGNGFNGQYSVTYDGEMRPTKQGNSTLLHRNIMWQTFNLGWNNQTDDFSELGDGRIVSGDSGQKVNPYSDSVDVLMAAFANTPHDWRTASTNNPDVLKYWRNNSSQDVKQFNKEHAWNGYKGKPSEGGKPYGAICWEHLVKFAEAFKSKVYDPGYAGDWQSAFRDLDWSFKQNELLASIQLDPTDSDLFGVDKKFLYGFWYDSFAAKQQLFLIFVRAEPMMMGGGVTGQVPPQLGARAVALVWRDPTETKKRQVSGGGTQRYTPHRTRILFYHQFD